tara:strand:- start:273 stop:1412 length:1140 start_codon:yes stop_codon:yes gene_type:complete
MKHLLVTNDYPPKIGGIQSYLWEIYRRLPQDEVTVLCTPYEGSEQFDSKQTHRIIRTKQKVLLPTSNLAKEIQGLVLKHQIDLVMFDPAVPVGMLGPKIGSPYGVILHGAEVTIPGRVPILKKFLKKVLRGSELVITAGEYSTLEAERAAGCELPVSIVPPGVDIERFKPLSYEERNQTRKLYNLKEEDEVVLALSRLVPRKGMDVLIRACSALKEKRPNLKLLIAGTGRDKTRLEKIAKKTNAPVQFLSHVPDQAIPSLYGMADIFSMLCRVRWGGLEQEGFGIVFLEAAATGVPQIAGRSGGASEAVSENRTGKIVHNPKNIQEIIEKIELILDNREQSAVMGRTSRDRATNQFSYAILAQKFHQALAKTINGLKEN